MRRGYADTSQGQMHYYEAGKGAPLVMLHASPRSGRVYDRLIPFLAERYRVIAFDTLGFGLSDPLPAGATMESLATRVTEAMTSLGIRQAHLFGFHTGNKIGAALAANHADRLHKFVLVGMTHSIVIDRAKRDAAILDLVKDGMSGKVQDPAAVRLREWAKLGGWVGGMWFKADVIDRPNLSEDHLDMLGQEIVDKVLSRRAFDPIYRANFAFDLTDAMKRIPVPTLIVELVTPQEEHLGRQGEAVKKLFKNAELVVFEHTDRGVLEKEPNKLASAVLAFLAR
ncbi:MAG: alpha/beta hydrolase [Alphaproteobacteria bacterium]|nr:alpha/beta hydrolase [Alphaproteobacteria bacterium]